MKTIPRMKYRDYDMRIFKKNGCGHCEIMDMTPLVAKQFYGYKDDCPSTEKFVDRLLTIPNYYSLTDKELLKVASAVKKIGELT